MDDVVVQYVARYGGARPCKHLNTRTASLNVIRFRTGSQCNSRMLAIYGRTFWLQLRDGRLRSVSLAFCVNAEGVGWLLLLLIKVAFVHVYHIYVVTLISKF